MKEQPKRTEQDIIVLGLIAIYTIAVGLLGVYRMWHKEYNIMILDWSLVATSVAILIYTWRTNKTLIASYYVSALAIVGTELTVALRGLEQIFWAYPAVALVFYLLPPKHALLLWAIGFVLLVLQMIDASISAIIVMMTTLIVSSMFCWLFAVKMKTQNENLRKLARQDVMTKIHNRRAFYEDLKSKKAVGVKLTAIFIDLDNFKSVNDQLGHVEGDRVLKLATDVIKDLLEHNHRLYRMGGDEFVVLAQHLEWSDICHLSETIHQEFERNEVAQKYQLTLSMAVGARHGEEPIGDWLNRLDEALYEAKKKGRNQVIFLTD